MRTILMSRALGAALCVMLSNSHAAIPPKLPAELPINHGAGRGGMIIVPVRLEDGEELPFVLDTGSTGTLVDRSLEPKLGKRLGTTTLHSWGTSRELPVFAAPRLYLGGVPLNIGDRVIIDDCKRMPSDSGPPIMGMLTIDCLRQYCIQLDFAAGKMRFLEPEHVNAVQLGKAFPITWVGGRPFVHHDGLVQGIGTNSLIDTGFPTDGVIAELGPGTSYFAERVWAGQTYTNLLLGTGGNVLGLRFLARHLATLDFLNGTMYLRQQSVGPLPGGNFMVLKTTRVEALEPLLRAVVKNDAAAASKELLALEQGSAPEPTKTVARKLVGTMRDEPKSVPASVPPEVTELALGDAQPRSAEVGWFKPAANRIPVGSEVGSPLLDSGKIYATGLWAHSPSRYVFDLGGKWKSLHGEAGLHTAMLPHAFGVVFVIKTDGREAFRSLAIRGPTKPSYTVDVTGVKMLELIVEKAAERNGGNWGLWLDPVLSR
jgi:hypothetical protein